MDLLELLSVTEEIDKITIADILKLNVSYQSTAYSSINKEVTINEVLNQIHSGIHSHQISRLRTLLKNGDKEGYNAHKKNLPAVTFCGTFKNERKKGSLKEYNFLIVLDIDKLSLEQLQQAKTDFQHDEFVFAYWESPSQQGLKGLVHLSFSQEIAKTTIDTFHKAAFKKLAKYFADSYKIVLDYSGSDTTRLCFLSSDPSLVIKSVVKSFPYNDDDLEIMSEPRESEVKIRTTRDSSKLALYNPKNRNLPTNRNVMQSIIRFLAKRNLSITNSYENWYKVSLAIANAFTYEIGEKYFLKLSSMDKEKFNESNCRNLLYNSYQVQTGEITFKTIEYFAIQKGYVTKKIREGSSEAFDENLSQVSASNDG